MKIIDKGLYRLKKIKHNLAVAYTVADDAMKFWDAIPRQIGPALLEEYPSHTMVDTKTYVETLLVGIPDGNLNGFPEGMDQYVMNDILNLHIKGCRITVSLSLVPISPQDAAEMLRKAELTNMVNQLTARKESKLKGLDSVPLELLFDFESLKGNYKMFHSRKHNLFHLMLIVVLAANTPDKLRTVKGLVMQKLKSKLILVESPLWRQKQTFLLAQPFPGWEPYASVETFTETATVLAPFSTLNHQTDAVGSYLGVDQMTNKRVVIDITKLPVRHRLYVGPSGSGKTFTMLLHLMREYTMFDKRIIVTTNKPDVTTDISAVITHFCGTVMRIGTHGDNINIFQILYDEYSFQSSYDYVIAFDAQKGLIQQFFDVFLMKTTPPQRSRLDKYITEVYSQKGIFRSDPSTWKDADWPTIQDLRELFKRDMDGDVSAEALYHNTYQFEPEGELGYMNRKTSIDLSSNFIFLDLSGIPAVVKDAMNVFITGIIGLRFRADVNKKTIISIDEAGNIIRDPEIANFLIKLVTQGRSMGIEIWAFTQQPTDLIKANVSEEMKTNTPINIILGATMHQDSIQIVKDYFMLSPEEIKTLLRSNVGEGILRIQNHSWPIQFKPTPLEMGIIKGKSTQKAPEQGAYILTHTLELAREHNIILDQWIIGGDAGEYLRYHGLDYVKYQNIPALGTGSVTAWIDRSIIKDNKIFNSSKDHYVTVVQIGAYFAERGLKYEINHFDDVDIVATLPDGSILAIEYERPGTHTVSEIIIKHQKALEKAKRCIVVCQAQNLRVVEEAVGKADAIPRGTALKETLDKLCQPPETT